MRVLVVDDNEEMRQALKGLLEQSGYQVEVAPDGEKAQRIQRARPADVLVTDIFMPATDGLELIQAFRAGYPQMRIVAMSGDAHIPVRTDYLSVARTAGADATLQKPFPPKALLDTLRPQK